MSKVIPFGDRILCKRRKVGEKIGKDGLLYASDNTKDSPTDLADVIYVPELTFGDEQILNNAEKIICSMVEQAKAGNSDSLIALLRLNEFLKIKSIKEGDGIMISKYVGTDFNTSDSQEILTLVNGADIIGLVIDKE